MKVYVCLVHRNLICYHIIVSEGFNKLGLFCQVYFGIKAMGSKREAPRSLRREIEWGIER